MFENNRNLFHKLSIIAEISSQDTKKILNEFFEFNANFMDRVRSQLETASIPNVPVEDEVKLIQELSIDFLKTIMSEEDYVQVLMPDSFFFVNPDNLEKGIKTVEMDQGVYDIFETGMSTFHLYFKSTNVLIQANSL